MEDQDPLSFSLKHLRILAKNGTLVPLELNEVQRAILLKARRMRICPPHVASRLFLKKAKNDSPDLP